MKFKLTFKDNYNVRKVMTIESQSEVDWNDAITFAKEYADEHTFTIEKNGHRLSLITNLIKIEVLENDKRTKTRNH